MELSEHTILRIVNTLSFTWERMKAASFWENLALVHGRKEPLDPSQVQCMVIGHGLDGNFNTGSFRGFFAGWWKVSDEGLERTQHLNLQENRNLMGVNPTPLIRFYTDGIQIFVGERYGPSLVSRKLGILTETDSWLDELKLIQIIS